MKQITRAIATALLVIPMSAATFTYADSSSGTTNTNASAGVSTSAETKFMAQYQKNQQTEADLLQQAQQVQSANTAAYASAVTTLQAQIGTLYGSEQALAQLGLTLGNFTKLSPDQVLKKQEQGLEAKLKTMITQAGKNRQKTHHDKQQLAKARADMSKLKTEINHLNRLVQIVDRGHGNSGTRDFTKSVASLRQTILGLQNSEIRVTQSWIAADQQSVTGSVYGSSSSSTSNTTGSN